ncbi:hypothetical protein AQUCO_00600302v1 [Aquilegia coerulea]|uniref:Uncharacterized protein n=1 Tax=Aquilegia coerulea TaxID=218851 RepID=A0A2G5ENX4_AQUCA|nr:hypothetical protein AQUCO_00600302v1 [Aquilegia coerulea]
MSVILGFKKFTVHYGGYWGLIQSGKDDDVDISYICKGNKCRLTIDDHLMTMWMDIKPSGDRNYHLFVSLRVVQPLIRKSPRKKQPVSRYGNEPVAKKKVVF